MLPRLFFFFIMLLPYPIYFPNEIDGLGAVPREILIANHFVDYLSIIHSVTACQYSLHKYFGTQHNP